jgi:hypothetical protein
MVLRNTILSLITATGSCPVICVLIGSDRTINAVHKNLFLSISRPMLALLKLIAPPGISFVEIVPAADVEGAIKVRKSDTEIATMARPW